MGERGPCEFCELGWPMCPACAALTDGGMDTSCPHCGDTKGHVSPEAHADFLELERDPYTVELDALGLTRLMLEALEAGEFRDRMMARLQSPYSVLRWSMLA